MKQSQIMHSTVQATERFKHTGLTHWSPWHQIQLKHHESFFGRYCTNFLSPRVDGCRLRVGGGGAVSPGKLFSNPARHRAAFAVLRPGLMPTLADGGALFTVLKLV